ncbi:hypothetical protein RYX36_005778 [Vicia faba]
MFCATMINVSKELSIPTLVFYTSGVAFLGLVLHLHTLRERDNIDSDQLLQLTELAVPSFTNSVPSKTLPTIVLRKEWESFFMNYAEGLKNADDNIVNSFEELEFYAVQSFLSHPGLFGLPIYLVGPLLNYELKIDGTIDFVDVIKWLNDQPISSVVFFYFGSRGSFDEDQFKEIALAIENSGARFVWFLHKPPSKGTMALPSEYPFSDLDSVLPEGFLDQMRDIGMVIRWAPQVQILAHSAIGGFVSHCGWNLMLKSIYLAFL